MKTQFMLVQDWINLKLSTCRQEVITTTTEANLLWRFLTLISFSPTRQGRPVERSQSILMTKRWARMLVRERWRARWSTSVPRLAGSEVRRAP